MFCLRDMSALDMPAELKNGYILQKSDRSEIYYFNRSDFCLLPLEILTFFFPRPRLCSYRRHPCFRHRNCHPAKTSPLLLLLAPVFALFEKFDED